MSIEEERFKATASQNADRIRSVSGSFSQYVLLLSAVAAGIAWMRVRPNVHDNWTEMRSLLNGVIIFLGVQAVARIATDVLALWSLRRTETTLTRGGIPAPRFPRSFVQESIFVAIILAATVVGIALVNSLG